VENSPEGLQASSRNGVFVVVNPLLLCVAFCNIADTRIVRLIFCKQACLAWGDSRGDGTTGARDEHL
jgi:hypothetical protein